MKVIAGKKIVDSKEVLHGITRNKWLMKCKSILEKGKRRGKGEQMRNGKEGWM